MTEFDPEKFDEKYVHYFEEIEAAYSRAYQHLHGQYDSETLKLVDRQVLSESEPVYEGGGEFSVSLPDDIDERRASLSNSEQFDTVLDTYTERITHELRQIFEFET